MSTTFPADQQEIDARGTRRAIALSTDFDSFRAVAVCHRVCGDGALALRTPPTVAHLWASMAMAMEYAQCFDGALCLNVPLAMARLGC